MNPTAIPGANRIFKAPIDWDAQANGPCEDLPVLDTGDFFQAAWLPDPQEIECMRAGAPVVVTIWGRSLPPHSVSTMPKPGYVTVEAYQAAFSALRNLTFMCRTASGLALGANADPQLLGSIELAESVVGQIPADASRKGGDPKMLEVPVPQGMPDPREALLREAAGMIANLAATDDLPAADLFQRIQKSLQP